MFFRCNAGTAGSVNSDSDFRHVRLQEKRVRHDANIGAMSNFFIFFFSYSVVLIYPDDDNIITFISSLFD